VVLAVLLFKDIEVVRVLKVTKVVKVLQEMLVFPLILVIKVYKA